MKKRLLWGVFIFIGFFNVYSGSTAWGNLKKIHFYHASGNLVKVMENLEAIDFSGVDQQTQDAIARSLVKFGDTYLSKNNYEMATAFYEKVIQLSSNYWYIYNKLEDINRQKGSTLLGAKNTLKQFFKVFNNFKPSFMLVNNALNVLFYVSILILLILALFFVVKYFRLAGNDLLVSDNWSQSIKKIIILLILLLWPVLFFGGWFFYPFLILGFLWSYFNDTEKKTITMALVIVCAASILYSLNLLLEKRAKSLEFKTLREVYQGELLDRDRYEYFDDELKIIQAYAYYTQQKYDTALDILNSTDERYQSELKYILLGNIHFKGDNLQASIKNFKECLQINEKNPVALNNFTLVLLENHNSNVFNSYAKWIPQISQLKTKVWEIKEVSLPAGFLWKRLLNYPKRGFNIMTFISGVLIEFLSLPILYIMLVFTGYTLLMKKIFPDLGKSTHCSKCAKIINEASVHKSYKLCDECYQLFLIKDVIFLEAKILKEKELKRKYRKKYLFNLLFSIIVPGLNLLNKERGKLFIGISMIFWVMLGFAGFGILVFTEIYSLAPLFLNYVGFLAILMYLLINVFSLRGDDYGL